MQNPRSALKSAYSAIKKSLSDPELSAWVSDNFYIIDKHYRMLLKNRGALSKPRLFKKLFSFCQTLDFSFTPQRLKTHLEKERGLDLDSLCAVKPLISASAILCIGKALRDKKRSFLLENAVKLLFGIDDPDYEDMIPALWAPEAVLVENEPQYTELDRKTKADYRLLISRYAKRRGIGELAAVFELLERARREDKYIGSYLFVPNKRFTALWCASFLFFFAALSAISFYFIGFITLILTIPFAVASGAVSDILVSSLITPYRAPRLELTQLPDNAKTLIAVAALLSGNDESVFESLSRFSCMNPDKNIYFCLLADLPDSENRYRSDDSAIINAARERIDALNRLYGDRFCLFLRERVYNKSESRFGGWERKRGAVCELVSHIVNGDSDEYYGGSFIREIKYLLTLDSDTNLSLSAVNELVSIALCPINSPKVENGRIVSGYGIIQPSVRTSLKSAYTTSFSRLISGAGGADPYSNADFARNQSLFGSGSFCGKGLIDVSLFERYLSSTLPEGLVLSHDIIEGGILRTLAATDITLTDSTPKNTVSYFRRAHRWMRGDFQNLYFLFSPLLPRRAKLRVFLTAARHLSPACTLLALICASFIKNSGAAVFLLSFSELLLPSVIAVLRFALSHAPFAPMRFFSKSYSLLRQTLSRLFFEISSCARRAMLALNALCLACIRLVTRKKTLEWTTAAQAERLSSSLGKYVLDGAFSALIGFMLLALARAPFVRLSGLLFFVYPLVSISLSRSLGGGLEVVPSLTEPQKRLLSAHCSDMVAFYLDNVNSATNHLPPDNIQLSPVYDTAYRTSPTNIGFYLVSLLAARDNGDITTNELQNRLSLCLDTVERLEKHCGNLYNWYDIRTLSVLGDCYVSAVDSGNFVSMLVALRQGLYDYLAENAGIGEIIAQTDRLIKETDLSVFYDKRKALLRIGIDPKVLPDKNCYDMLMSEARLTSYYAVASHILPKEHWHALNRTLTNQKGYIGMMSWSGTAFEYLMPQLFLPLYRDSFIYESIAVALMLQRAESSPWGISESGFYSFDSEMHYQYKANGIPALALRRITESEHTVSPYSTYLSLCFLGNSAIKNLKAFENRGLYGRYGLYEALDMSVEREGLCVKSYMAHHIGMSIIAVMNAIKNNIFIKRFMSDPFTAAASELLQEKIPTDAHIFENGNSDFRIKKAPSLPSRALSEKPSLSSPVCALISRGDLSLTVTSVGHIGLFCGERALAYTKFSVSDRRFTPTVLFEREGKSFGCTEMHGGTACSFERGSGYASHISSGKNFSGRVRWSLARGCNCFVVSTRAESILRYDITLAFEPILQAEKKYLSHISFSKLFIESEYDKQKKILYFHRRSGLDGRHIFSLAVALRDEDARFSFLASRENIKTAFLTEIGDLASLETDNKTGACIDPICLVRAENTEGGRASFLIACGDTKGECEKSIAIARSQKGDYTPPPQSPLLYKILPYVLYNYGAKKSDSLSPHSINSLWSKGISGDYPMLLVLVSELAVSRTDSLFSAFSELCSAGIRTELVFVTDDGDKYNRPAERAVRERCAASRLSRYLGANGGIFILRRDEIDDSLFSAMQRNAAFYYDFSSEPKPLLLNTGNGAIGAKPIISAAPTISEGAIRLKHGYFTENGFTVDKSTLPDSPYSYILTGRRFSAVVTQSSLGYTFFDNARERRLCSFYGDKSTLDNGERLLANVNGRLYDLCAISHTVVYEKGVATYRGSVCEAEYTLSVTVHPKYPIKLMRVRYHTDNPIETRFCIEAVSGNTVSAKNGIDMTEFSAHGNRALVFKSVFGMSFPEGHCFAGVCGGEADADNSALKHSSCEILFFLGACTTIQGAEELISRVSPELFDTAAKEARAFAESMLPKIKFKTESKLNDALMNTHLPYQVAACRFFARGSFYQSGGAYGFRDQLQDCLTLIYSSPELVRTHIIRCSAHQYLDGSVMHWWHTRRINRANSGIKSKCSDDLLYLPIVVADYIEKTEDRSLLDVEVHYLDSSPLGQANERYETPSLSAIKESVYLHCLRVFKAAKRVGAHGLILMGSCDWNDAFSLVGAKGVGESVFSTMLYIVAAEAFLPIIEKNGDTETALSLRDDISRFRENIEKHAFFGDRYARAICDNGKFIGIKGCRECEIDILSQAFAVFAGLDRERAKKALNTAFSELYDRKSRILKLFSPPFTNGEARVGYIRGYVAGIRENGGMYTHGALWGALACLKCGLISEAMLILDAASPALRSADKSLAEKYKNEPYAVSADIYSGEFAGRGGWSWYTGAASWYYRIFFEHVYGLKLGGNTIISARPLAEYEADIALGGAHLHVSASRTHKKALFDNEDAVFPISVEKGEHTLCLPIFD